jgi:CHAT domain-containing protein/Tfp pilus assembly protein PilF
MKKTFYLLGMLFLANVVWSQNEELALAKRYDFVADSLSRIPDNRQAILIRKKALNIYQNSRPVPFERLAAEFRSIGICYRREGKFEEAEFNLKRSVEIAEKHLSATHFERAKAYNSYGIFLFTTGKNKEAIKLLHLSLAINERNNSPDVSDNLNNLGIAYENLGDYSEAFEHYQQALKVNRKKYGLNNLSTANTYMNLGTACSKLDRLGESMRYFDTTLTIYEKVLPKNHPEFAALYNNMGAVANFKGDYQSALAFFDLALKNNQINLGENHPDVANIYANAGMLLLNRGDIKKALAFFNKAYDIRIRFFGKNNHFVARTSNYLGDCYLQSNDFDNAFKWYMEAIQIYNSQPTGDPTDIVEYNNDLGYYYEKLGNQSEALKFYKAALSVVRKQPNKQDLYIANSLNRIGNLYLSKNNLKLAKQQFEQALQINLQLLGRWHPDVAQIYSNLALVNSSNEGLSIALCDSAMAAISYSSFAPVSFEKVSSPIVLLDVFRNKGALLQGFYEKSKTKKWLLEADKNYSIAIQLIDFVKLTLEEPGSRQALLEKYFKIYENAIAVKFALKELTNDASFWHQAFEVSERSNATLLLEALQSVQAGRFAEIPDSLLETERRLKIDMAYLERLIFEEKMNANASDPKKLAKLNNQLFSLQQQTANLMARLRKDYPNYFTLKYAPELVKVPEIQTKLLRPAQNMLGYFVGEESIFAFVIGESSFEVVKIPNEFPLEAWVQEFRNSIYRFNPAGEEVDFLSQKYTNLGYELYQLLFEPVQSKLTGNQVVVLPGGVIGYLPFDALLASPPDDYGAYDTHDYLIKHYQFSYSYSATLHKEMLGRNSNWRRGGFVAFAPSYGGDSLNMRRDDPWRAVLGNLKFNQSEVKSIKDIMGGQVFLDTAATELNFTKAAPDAGILHLAVHAKSNDEHGEYSYLAFYQTLDSIENELVFVKDLYSMRIKAALVVLSACETGIGELQRGEGIVSLARGFSYAGAASIVTTLWSIDDFASSEIMRFFYQNLKKGQEKDEALRNAKLNFLKNRQGTNASHPLYWAAFIPVGDMSALNGLGWPVWAWGAVGLGLTLLAWRFLKKKKVNA